MKTFSDDSASAVTGYEPGLTLYSTLINLCLLCKLLHMPACPTLQRHTYNDVVVRLRDTLDDYPANPGRLSEFSRASQKRSIECMAEVGM
jgi:hypothetical protein